MSKSLVEAADRKSRLRAILFGFATLVFLFVQVITHPVFDNEAYSHGWRYYSWAFNVALLLACLGGGGGLMNRPQLRALINDDVARSHYQTACKVGFWIAMVVGLGLYGVPAFTALSGKQVGYLIVTLASAGALLTFSWLEYRAHNDA